MLKRTKLGTDILVDFMEQCIYIGGKAYPSQPMALTILRGLVEREHRIYYDYEIVRDVWGDLESDGTRQDAIKTKVSDLNRVFGQQIIKRRRKVGYQIDLNITIESVGGLTKERNATNPHIQEMRASIDGEDFSAFEFVGNDRGMGDIEHGSRIRRCDFDKQHTTAHNEVEVSSNDLPSKLVKENFLDAPFAEITFDMYQVRTFASCGKEATVFKVTKLAGGHGISLTINFEKTRLRDEIPEYAGAYYLKHPAVDISGAKQIRFWARSEDKTIESICVELKPEQKAWMHETFCFHLTSENKEYTIDLANVSYPETLKRLEEVTFVLNPYSFTNENDLTGKLEISNLVILCCNSIICFAEADIKILYNFKIRSTFRFVLHNTPPNIKHICLIIQDAMFLRKFKK